MIKLNNDCCGCGACYTEAVELFENTISYTEGFAAARNGLSISVNPYEGTDEYTAWRAGWLKANNNS